MLAPVKLGVVGFGIMGERLLRAALEHDQGIITPCGVFDPAPAAAARLAAIAPEVPMMESAEAVIESCDVLYIATPPLHHLPLAKAGFAAGKAVFIEKPLSVDLEEAREMVEQAEASGARAAVNFPMASSPAVAQLKQWRDKGAVGSLAGLEIEVAFASWPRPWQRDAASWLARSEQGGFTREVISHFLFLTRRHIGKLRLQSARVARRGNASETAVEAKLVSSGGLGVSLRGQVGMIRSPDQNRWTLTGASGAIRLRDWSIAERLGPDGWAPPPEAVPNEIMRPMVLKGQLDKLVALTRGEAAVGLATLREALEVQEVVEAILASG